jgi:RIO kinase 1
LLAEGFDEELGVLRAGKEAGCFLVRRSVGERFCLLVRKDYRKRSDRTYSAPVRAGERGLRRDRYLGAVYIAETRQRRAAHNRTSHGWNVLEGAIAHHEFSILRRLWEAGASVPYPVAVAERGFLMQYIGTLGCAAPRLADVRLERVEATKVFDRLVGDLRVFAREGIVHGDLSPYNVLLQHGRPWIIDVPQAVDLFLHEEGHALFARDITNLCDYFKRAAVRCDADQLVEDLLG